MAWSIVGVGSVVEVTATTHTLTEPAGCAAGDLLVACIGSRIASTTSITLPTGWKLAREQKVNNIVAGTTGQASACMAFIVRGASAPALTFTHPAAPNVARGQIVAYRENTAGNSLGLDAAGGIATGTAITAISVTGAPTTTAANDLLVGMLAGGSAATYTAFKTANAPSTASGATTPTGAPSTTTWTERADASSATGADLGLGVFDAVKTATGACGTVTATASVSSGHSFIIGAFISAVPTADAWNAVDKTAVTLSNSDKTATSTGSTAGARSTTTLNNGTAGKYYAEFKLEGSSLTGNVGIADASIAVLTGTVGAFCMAATGNILINGGNPSTGPMDIGTPALNDVFCIAWDAGAERVWFRLNGDVWNNSGTADPATGAEGIDCSFAAATPHALWMRGTGSGQATTIRTELAEYTQAVPSGFLSWMGESAGGTPVTVTVTGQGVAAAVGAVTVSIPAPVSITVSAVGQAVTAAVGDPSVTGKSSFIATGQAVTSAVGPLALIVTHARFTVASDVMIASTQGVGVSAGGSISTTASGSEITSGVGQVSVKADHRFSVTGQQVTGSVGEVLVTAKSNVSTIPVGQATSAGVGQVIVDARATVSTTAIGQGVAASVGEVSVGTVFRIDDSVTPAGQEITAAVGTPTVTGKANVSTIPTGQALATAVGIPTITANIGVSTLLAGQEIVSAVGVPTITTHARFTVTGQAVTSAVGTIGVTSGTGVTVLAGLGGAIAPPVYRPHTLTSYADRGDTVMGKPTGTAENDILIAAMIRVVLGAPGAADVVQPAGFTKIGTTTSVTDGGSNNGRFELWWKRATASEPATYTFAQWSASATQGLMVAYSGCPTSGNPIDVYSQNSANSGSTATGLGVTTTQAQDNLLWLGHNWDASTTLTPPSGMTERADSLLYLSEQAITAAGATGNRTQAQASAGPWAVFLLALKGSSGVGAGLSGLVASVSPPAAVNTQAMFTVTGQEVIASGRGVNVTAGGSVSTTVSSGLATTAVGQVSVKADHRFAITGTQADTAVGQVTVDARQTVSTTVVGQSLAAALSPVTVTAGIRVSTQLAGQAVTAAVGAVNFSLAISALVPVSSEGISAGVGAIFFPTGINDSVTLAGQSAQAEVGAVTVTTVALRGMDVWTGTAWAGKPAKVWTGSAWVPKPVKLWNGSSWV